MSVSHEAFLSLLKSVASDTEAMLSELLAQAPVAGERDRPARLIEAMRYSSLSGGKRIRPLLVVASGNLFGVPRRRSLMAGAALELIHCYSLVHDDLPAMDNDDTRRGRPTTHKAFDEATAILAGDGLLTLAFDVAARPAVHPEAEVRVNLVGALARAAGIGGMVGGQLLDLAAEGRFADGKPQSLDETAIGALQAMKTGALLQFACAAGAILGKASVAEREALDRYGMAVGKAFQIADDLLDVEGDSATLGKAAGKDAAAGKATLVGDPWHRDRQSAPQDPRERSGRRLWRRSESGRKCSWRRPSLSRNEGSREAARRRAQASQGKGRRAAAALVDGVQATARARQERQTVANLGRNRWLSAGECRINRPTGFAVVRLRAVSRFRGRRSCAPLSNLSRRPRDMRLPNPTSEGKNA